MMRLAVAPIAAPTLVHSDVVIFTFTPQDCTAGISCAPFQITIDTHHTPIGPVFDYGGTTAPIRQIPIDGAAAQSYVTLGHADREVLTMFDGDYALHTR